MSIRSAAVTLLVTIVFSISGPAKPQIQAPAENPLNQIAWLVGGKWIADGDKGPDGTPFHVELSCSWGDNRRVIQFTTMFRINGKLVPVYTGLYAWHPAKKKLVFLYTDNQGSLTEGEASMTGDRLEQEFQIVGADTTAHVFRSTIVRRGSDDYDWNVLHEKDGAWVEIFALKYKRARD
jgi:hypothetical protein